MLTSIELNYIIILDVFTSSTMASASKRDRSPSPTLSPRKRPRQLVARHVRSQPSHESGGRTATIGGGINDIVSSHEIFLNVLSFLDAEELTKVEGVSRYWRSMALDSHVSRAGKTASLCCPVAPITQSSQFAL
jgi:hypothetical protein